VITPHEHAWHHSSARTDVNFGANLSLWDRVHGAYAAHAALELAALKMEAGDTRGALGPLLVVCDSLADDRLAPLARQRAGDAYLALGDEEHALAEYEECLARYPRAWNSAEVRRRVEKLRKEKSLGS